jgi:AcrR family transcriptional regulator
MPEILALSPGREGRRVVEGQLRNIRAEVTYLNSRSELRLAVTAGGVRAVVSDLFDGDGRPMAPFLRDLNHEFPELKIVLSYDPSPATLDDVLDAATCGARFAFCARAFNDVGQLLEPMLALRSSRPPSAAESLVVRVVPNAETAAARRCLTLATVSPAHRMTIRQVARFCDTTERTLYRHLESIASPKLLLSALAWPQANYLLTVLHWRARQVADFFGYHRPALLIDLLADYVESGLWNLGLDAAVDGTASVAADALEQGEEWIHRRHFRPRGELALELVMGRVTVLNDMAWTSGRRDELGERILTLLSGGLSPMEIVRHLWRRYDMAPGHLYGAVMQMVEAVRSGGLIEER